MPENRKCKLSGQILELIYSETDGTRLRELRSHLSVCDICSNDFSAFSMLRSDIGDLKKAAFDPLPTPVISLPPAQKDRTVANTALPWFESLRQVFAFRAAFAGILLLVFCGIVGVMYFGNHKDALMAANSSVAAPADPPKALATPDSAGLPPSAIHDDRTGTSKPKVSPNGTPESKFRGTIPNNPRSKGSAPAKRKPTLPRSDETLIEDLADDSLRLSDLLEQIGG